MTCALCLGPIAELAEGSNVCPHCGAVAVVVAVAVVDEPAEAVELEEEDA
jgi:uncharacterized Zn finger protein (UPF0148 family)